MIKATYDLDIVIHWRSDFGYDLETLYELTRRTLQQEPLCPIIGEIRPSAQPNGNPIEGNEDFIRDVETERAHDHAPLFLGGHHFTHADAVDVAHDKVPKTHPLGAILLGVNIYGLERLWQHAKELVMLCDIDP